MENETMAELKFAEQAARNLLKKSKGNQALETLYAQWALEAQKAQARL